TNTPRGTPYIPPTETPTPTITPSPIPTESFAGLPPTPTVFYPPEFTPEAQPTGIPTAMPRFIPRDQDNNAYNVVNILLLGHDSESLQVDNVFRTDTMIVVNVNLDTQTVSMLSLPRDLLVWVSGWGMQRLNLVWGRGEAIGWTDGGWGLLRQTILYNFGIEAHYYAMVDFTGFKTIIDTVGGVTIPVDCPLQDYLWTGEYDANDQPIFELTTLPIGVHEMNSRVALWYARTRRNSSDFDRGRRQQQILRAIWTKSKDLGLITQLPTLWDSMNEVVDTNISLPMMIELAPLALSIEPADIENHFFMLGLHTLSFALAGGENVQVPNPDQSMLGLVLNFLSPPTENVLVADAADIQIYDGSGSDAQWDSVAADRLLWEGLLAQSMGTADEVYPETVLIDYVGESKGSAIEQIISLLNINPQNIQIEPDPDRTSDYKIILGQNYNSCVGRQVQEVENLPPMTPTPNP
ncbi:MAG: LCP family protein, partial [Anaerolineae bacterium]|nr:LCP family protein [Anaerolineae bacterium]